MAKALIWLDDIGGIIWLKHHFRWSLLQTFTWDKLIESPILLPKFVEVSILSGLSGERLVWDVLPNMRLWHRRAITKRKLSGYFPQMPYVAGEIQGQINALQCRFCGIALPGEVLDSLFIYLHPLEAIYKEIIPASSLFDRMTQQKRLGKGIWIIFYRRMHLYFMDDLGLRLSRSMDLPINMSALGEEVKKIYRYLVGQKCLSPGQLLKVDGLVLDNTICLQSLPIIDHIQWRIDQTPKNLVELSHTYRGKLNCLTDSLRNLYRWHYWSRLARYGAVMIIMGVLYGSVCVWKKYCIVQQEINQINLYIDQLDRVKHPLTKINHTLLAIDAYRHKYLDPDYEVLLSKLSHILAEFPSWHLESVDWQREAPHKMQLFGEWEKAEDVESMSTRLERTLSRQMQTKEIQAMPDSQYTKRVRIEMVFDTPSEGD